MCVCNSNSTAEFFHAVRPAPPPSPLLLVSRVRRLTGIPKHRLEVGAGELLCLFAATNCAGIGVLVLLVALGCVCARTYGFLLCLRFIKRLFNLCLSVDKSNHTNREPPPAAAVVYENLLPYLTGGCQPSSLVKGAH